MRKRKYPRPLQEDLRGCQLFERLERPSWPPHASAKRQPRSWLSTGAVYHPARVRATRWLPGRANPPLMPLEILHVPLVLFRRRARFEGAEIAALAGFRIHFSGIEPIFARLQFSDHGTEAYCRVFLALIAKPPLAFPWE